MSRSKAVLRRLKKRHAGEAIVVVGKMYLPVWVARVLVHVARPETPPRKLGGGAGRVPIRRQLREGGCHAGNGRHFLQGEGRRVQTDASRCLLGGGKKEGTEQRARKKGDKNEGPRHAPATVQRTEDAAVGVHARRHLQNAPRDVGSHHVCLSERHRQGEVLRRVRRIRQQMRRDPPLGTRSLRAGTGKTDCLRKQCLAQKSKTLEEIHTQSYAVEPAHRGEGQPKALGKGEGEGVHAGRAVSTQRSQDAVGGPLLQYARGDLRRKEESKEQHAQVDERAVAHVRWP